MDSDKRLSINRSLSNLLCYVLGVFSILITGILYAQENDMILELKDIQFFQVQEIKSLPVKIKLTGLVFHSSLGIKDVKKSENDGTMRIMIHLVPVTTTGLSGNLDNVITIPKSIDKIVFGNDGVVIWNRTDGVIQHK